MTESTHEDVAPHTEAAVEQVEAPPLELSCVFNDAHTKRLIELMKHADCNTPRDVVTKALIAYDRLLLPGNVKSVFEPQE